MGLIFKKRIYVKLSPEAQELLDIYKLTPEERREKYLDKFDYKDLLLTCLWSNHRLGLQHTKVAPWGEGHETDLLGIIFEKDDFCDPEGMRREPTKSKGRIIINPVEQ